MFFHCATSKKIFLQNSILYPEFNYNEQIMNRHSLLKNCRYHLAKFFFRNELNNKKRIGECHVLDSSNIRDWENVICLNPVGRHSTIHKLCSSIAPQAKYIFHRIRYYLLTLMRANKSWINTLYYETVIINC